MNFYAGTPADSYLTNPLFVSNFPTDFAEISQKAKTIDLVNKLYAIRLIWVNGIMLNFTFTPQFRIVSICASLKMLKAGG